MQQLLPDPGIRPHSTAGPSGRNWAPTSYQVRRNGDPRPSPGPCRPLRSPQGFWPGFLSATGRAPYALWDLPGTPSTAPVWRTPAQRTAKSQKAWGLGRLSQQATWALPSLCPLRVSRDLPTSPPTTTIWPLLPMSMARALGSQLSCATCARGLCEQPRGAQVNLHTQPHAQAPTAAPSTPASRHTSQQTPHEHTHLDTRRTCGPVPGHTAGYVLTYPRVDTHT